MGGNKKLKQVLNIEYKKKYDAENFDEFNTNNIETKRSNKNYHNKYIPNNFRNNSYGKKTIINNNEDQNRSQNSLNIKNIRHQNNVIPRKKYTNSNSTNSMNIINFNSVNKNENSKIGPESFRLEDNLMLGKKMENVSRNKPDKLMEDKFYKNEFNLYDENNNGHRPKNKGKNINYNNDANSGNVKSKNFNGETIDTKRKKNDSYSNRYINTINNKENTFYHF